MASLTLTFLCHGMWARLRDDTGWMATLSPQHGWLVYQISSSRSAIKKKVQHNVQCYRERFLRIKCNCVDSVSHYWARKLKHNRRQFYDKLMHMEGGGRERERTDRSFQVTFFNETKLQWSVGSIVQPVLTHSTQVNSGHFLLSARHLWNLTLRYSFEKKNWGWGWHRTTSVHYPTHPTSLFHDPSASLCVSSSTGTRFITPFWTKLSFLWSHRLPPPPSSICATYSAEAQANALRSNTFSG